jgi:hypothetical protein
MKYTRSLFYNKAFYTFSDNIKLQIQAAESNYDYAIINYEKIYKIWVDECINAVCVIDAVIHNRKRNGDNQESRDKARDANLKVRIASVKVTEYRKYCEYAEKVINDIINNNHIDNILS